MFAIHESTNYNLIINGPNNASVSLTQDEVLNLAKTELAKSDTSVKLFWNYPTGAMTIIIETAFTEKQKSYAIRIDGKSLKPAISNVYRILDDQETEVAITDDDIILDSDSNYQVIVKFQGPSETTYYGVYINYDIIPK